MTNILLKHIPNALTLFRLLIIVPFLLFLFNHEYVYAFYTFFLAGISDCLDGWSARYFGWQSFFGSFLDPIADKSLVAASFISLAILGVLPWWLVILVFARDFSIGVGVLAWYWFINRKPDFQPTRLSKLNTLFQISLVTVCLFELAYFQLSPYLIPLLIILTAITTASTYIDYVWTWGKKAWSINENPQ